MQDTGNDAIAEQTFLHLAAAGLFLIEDLERRQDEGKTTRMKDNKILHEVEQERRVWVKEWLSRRYQFGHYDQLIAELQKEDISSRNYLRITPNLFQGWWRS